MKKFFTALFITTAAFAVAQKKPKLVVGIVVDQMRQDYLLRFSERFGEDGFNRLLKEGYHFRNAHYNYIPTYTAPGHASIYTGTTPSNHGIIGNSWFSRKTGLSTYCVSDLDQQGVGGSGMSGMMSPKNLIASTVTDELRLTSNFRSKVVGVSIKDRGSVLPAGHNPTGAYWLDSKTGNFITSTYYTDALPEWVESFNQKKLAAQYLDGEWNTLLPIGDYKQSTTDENEYEQLYSGRKNSTFPYNLKKLAKSSGVGIVKSTPFGNSLVLDMALEAIEGEQLGADQDTDFLAISFSSTDYVGHQFGPNSVELEDTYLRLDREIERLLTTLDEQLGDDYFVFLTADHGVVNVPQFLIDNKLVGGYLEQEKVQARLQKMIDDELGPGEWIQDMGNDQLFLNEEFIAEQGKDIKEVRSQIRDIVLKLDEVFDALTRDEILKRNSNNVFYRKIENGFNTKMSGDIAVRLHSGYLSVSKSYGKQGTSHGSGYNYDTHVPLLFYGSGIKQGSSVRPVKITDIAPTVSMLLNISLPSAATGEPLKELFE